jgi:hypothetical protein
VVPGEHRLEEFANVVDADELCRRLLRPGGGGGSSTRHQEAVELLQRVSGSGELGEGLVALLLCTCPRWDRVTGRLIADIESSGVVSDAELDELAETFLDDEVEIVYPLAWVSPEWLEIDLEHPGSGKALVVDEDTPARDRRRVAPPLRRWAAHRVLSFAPWRLEELLIVAPRLDPHARGALILGMLDAAARLSEGGCRKLVRLGLSTGMARVRRAALDVLCELDGVDAALARARSDGDASVRSWQPRELCLL